jgi:hypothetical protein
LDSLLPYVNPKIISGKNQILVNGGETDSYFWYNESSKNNNNNNNLQKIMNHQKFVGQYHLHAKRN